MYLLKNFYILNPSKNRDTAFDFYKGDLRVANGKIVEIYRTETAPGPRNTEGLEVIDGEFRKMICPGFVQSHIHFCQTLHRNRAEEMPLIQWLKQEIWPYEAALTPHTMGRAVIMALKEVLSSGVTAALDMGTVHHQDVIFDIMARTGFRYTGGKAMMDLSDGVPRGLTESTDDSIRQSMDLYERYHGAADGLLHYAFAPRFVLSCTPDLLKEVRKLSDEHEIIIHTHASEHPEEVAFIRKTTGYGNIAYLDHLGALNRHSVIAHMVNLDENEKQLTGDHQLSIVHCPTTNLKLGSGVAPVTEYLEQGLRVGLGSDGAPCNNSLSMFNELKLAPLLQKGISHDPLTVTSEDALRMATVHGAEILRREQHVGRIETGMDADLVLLNMDTARTYNFETNPAAAVVYGADARNVYATMVKGRFLYKNGTFSNEINELDDQYNHYK